MTEEMIILNFVIFFGSISLYYFLRKHEIQRFGKPVSVLEVIRKEPSLTNNDVARFLGKQIGLWICGIYISDWIFRADIFISPIFGLISMVAGLIVFASIGLLMIIGLITLADKFNF